ncbi:Dabb family protein [Rhodococcus sp. D2-41]|nr:Dabb family protein [Rhodococcus sp. D2-41]
MRIVHHRDDASLADAVENLRRAALSAGATHAQVSPTLPGTINGGDLIVRLRFADAAAWRHARAGIDHALAAVGTDRVHGAEFAAGQRDRRQGGPSGNGVYRALLLRVAPSAPPDVVQSFERDLLRMPAFVPAMHAWQLSRVDVAEGPCAWTHVWEQEFDDLAGLSGPYLNHPVHWAVVDRWFDPECPDVIVRDRVCHTYCALDGPVIEWPAPGPTLLSPLD